MSVLKKLVHAYKECAHLFKPTDTHQQPAGMDIGCVYLHRMDSFQTLQDVDMQDEWSTTQGSYVTIRSFLSTASSETSDYVDRVQTPTLKQHKPIPSLRHKDSPAHFTLREICLRDARSEEALRQLYEDQTAAYLDSPLATIGIACMASG